MVVLNTAVGLVYILPAGDVDVLVFNFPSDLNTNGEINLARDWHDIRMMKNQIKKVNNFIRWAI